MCCLRRMRASYRLAEATELPVACQQGVIFPPIKKWADASCYFETGNMRKSWLIDFQGEIIDRF